MSEVATTVTVFHYLASVALFTFMVVSVVQLVRGNRR